MSSKGSFTVLSLAFVLTVSICLSTVPATGQVGTTPSLDPHALLSGSLSALSGSTVISDISIQGNTTRNYGSAQDLGTISLSARLGQSRADWQVGSGFKTIVFDATTPSPTGWWVDENSQTHAFAEHNCMAGQVWFSPALLLAQLLQSNYTYQFIGAETFNGQAVNHVRVFIVVSSGSAKSKQLGQHLSTLDIYLDQTTLLPSMVRFQTHPEDDALTDIPIEARFSDYRSVNGIVTPFRIQRYQNGGLLYDVSVASVAVNSGVTPTLFTAH